MIHTKDGFSSVMSTAWCLFHIVLGVLPREIYQLSMFFRLCKSEIFFLTLLAHILAFWPRPFLPDYLVWPDYQVLVVPLPWSIPQHKIFITEVDREFLGFVAWSWHAMSNLILHFPNNVQSTTDGQSHSRLISRKMKAKRTHLLSV